jgi:hypothetical protein
MRPGLWSPWRLRSWQEVVWLIRVLVCIVIIFFGPYVLIASFMQLVLWLTGQW